MNPPLHAARVLDRQVNLFGCKYFPCWSGLSAILLTIVFPVLGDSTAYAKPISSQQPDAIQSATVSEVQAENIVAPTASLIPVVDSESVVKVEDILFIDSQLNQNDIGLTEQTIVLPDLDQLAQPQTDSAVASAITSEDAADVPADSNSDFAVASSNQSDASTLTQPSESIDRPVETDDRNAVPEAGSRNSQDLGNPLVQVQGVYTLQGSESSARGRVSTSYAISPNVLIGGTVDLTSGNAFADSPETGVDLNELYVALSPTELPNLRFVVGMLDLTSYFDRNSFAKDAATQFLNPVFQSNPALTAAGLGSRPAILLNWSVVDPLEIKVAGFSSDRDLGDFALDGFAAEAALRLDNFILRGTYITDRDADQDSGFDEVYQIARGGSSYGLQSGDREEAYGVNAEFFIPEINLGLFARYGWYENLELDRGGSTYSVGLNLLDLVMPADRLGLAYGRSLSNDDLRGDRDDDYPDVWELFYDFRITPNLRAGVTLQSMDQFSETIGGLRIRADFDSSDWGRLFR